MALFVAEILHMSSYKVYGDCISTIPTSQLLDQLLAVVVVIEKVIFFLTEKIGGVDDAFTGIAITEDALGAVVEVRVFVFHLCLLKIQNVQYD